MGRRPGCDLNLMAASLPWGLGFSRTRGTRAASRRPEEAVLDKPRPQGSHLTMRFKGGRHLGDAAREVRMKVVLWIATGLSGLLFLYLAVLAVALDQSRVLSDPVLQIYLSASALLG